MKGVLQENPHAEPCCEERCACERGEACGNGEPHAVGDERRAAHPDPPPGVAREGLDGLPGEDDEVADDGLRRHPGVVVGAELPDLEEKRLVHIDHLVVLPPLLGHLGTEKGPDTQRLQHTLRIAGVLMQHVAMEDF